MAGLDVDYFYELQTQTGWSRTLFGFAQWCAPQPGWLTLDVGCGPGLLPAVLAKLGCNSIGVDVDPKMFRPVPLHRVIATGDVFGLPFRAKTFDLVTASNLLFLLSRPTDAMVEMGRVLKIGGKLALLNPSENLNQSAAEAFSKAHGLEGLAQSSLITWARRAEENHRWTEDETRRLYSEAGLTFMADIIKVGPGIRTLLVGDNLRV